MLYLHPTASSLDGATLRRQHKTDGSCVNQQKAGFTFIAPLSVQLNDSHTLKTPRSVFQDGSGRWSPCTPRKCQGSSITGDSAGAACASAHCNHCQPTSNAQAHCRHCNAQPSFKRPSSAGETASRPPSTLATARDRPCALSAHADEVQHLRNTTAMSVVCTHLHNCAPNKSLIHQHYQ